MCSTDGSWSPGRSSSVRTRVWGKSPSRTRRDLESQLHRVDSRPVIALEHVTKTYPKASRPSINDVSVSIEKGEFVFFIGPSGSGKSTIVKLLLREIQPTNGKVLDKTKDGTSLRSWKVPYFRRWIGCDIQDFVTLPTRTADENVAFAL